MANIDERLLAAQLADQQRQARMSKKDKERQGQMSEADKERQGRMGEEDRERQTGEQAGGGSGSFRDRWRAAKQALNLKQRAKDNLEAKVSAPVVGMLKTKLLNLIPGYGPYVAFKNAVLMKKGKFTWVDIIIMLFSNLTACFTVFAFLAFIIMIMGWIQHPLQAISDLGWGAVTALVSLFKGLL